MLLPKVLLAPMAGVTDLPFRVLCKRFGCGLTYTEMVSAKGLHYNSAKSRELLEISPEETPAGVQLFGSDPEILAQIAAGLAHEYAGLLFVIDINMGCPAKKIVSNGEGSALMLNPALAGKIITAVVRAVNGKLPVTVKFRKGWDESSVNAVEFARMAEGSGASAVAVHGRTRSEFYSGRADWGIIKAVKQAVKIPVIGNGDVFSGESALKMFSETGCDAVMVARGAQGNPWIFAQIRAALNNEAYSGPTHHERITLAMEHAKALVAHKGERAVSDMRKHVAWYIKGLRGASELRARVNAAKTLNELLVLLGEYARHLPQVRT